MKSIKSLLIPLALFAACFAGVVGLQHGMIEKWRNSPKRFRDTLYLPSSEYVRVITLGYHQFTADFLWLRMIQVFAAAWSSAENPTQIRNYCDVITDLDPRFTDPYIFAIMGIGTEARDAVRAAAQDNKDHDPFGDKYLKTEQIDQYVMDVVNKAIVRNPGNYEVPYAGAFHAYYQLNQLDLAKYYVRMAKQDPKYPDYIDRWEGFFDLKQGRYRAAFEKFLGDYITAIRNRNKDIYSIIRNQLNRSLNSWLIDEIKLHVGEWTKAHNGEIPTIDQLIQAGVFKDFEYPRVQMVNDILQQMLDGRINPNLSDAECRQLAGQVMARWNTLPPGPYDFIDPRFRGYVIWKAMKDDEERFVVSHIEAASIIKGFVGNAALDVAREKAKNGKPPAFAYFEPYISRTDPFGKPWDYDPNTGVLKSATYPEIDKMDVPNVTGRE